MNGSLHCIRIFIKEQINSCYEKKAVKINALTGVLDDGATLHTLFKLTGEKDGKIEGNLTPLTSNYLKVFQNQLKDIEFLFIDKISMVPCKIFCMIDYRL